MSVFSTWALHARRPLGALRLHFDSDSRGSIGRGARWVRRHAVDLVAYLLVACIAGWVIWPVPLGQMPLSQDHPVHLARAWMLSRELAHGHLNGWSSYWYFGFPVGDLYPPLGDLAVVGLRAASFATLAWDRCYAYVFAFAFTLQGLVLVRIGRSLGRGVLPGLLAAALLLLDPGHLREGGWRYTVWYGVWLQPVATALMWWVFARLADSVAPIIDVRANRRAWVGTAVLVSLALIGHPIMLPTLALGLFVLLGLAAVRERDAFARVFTASVAAAVLGGMLAAWWLFPFIANRAWTSNFGTLYGSLERLFELAAEGVFTRRMPPVLGYVMWIGVAWAALSGNLFARFTAIMSLVLWLFSASDTFWLFRLDRLSEGFQFIQYERLLIVAKPGLYLMAGYAITGLLALGVRPRSSWFGRTLALGVTVAGLVTCWSIADAVGEEVAKSGIHQPQLTRTKEGADWDQDYTKFTAWARKQWRKSKRDYRFAYVGRRHQHNYADAPVWTGAPAYKVGFTPGEVFVHKVEGRSSIVLDRLRVKYVVSSSDAKIAKLERVADFGRISVWERPMKRELVEIDGAGVVDVLDGDVEDETLAVRVLGSAEDGRLVFNVAGYPRWELTHNGAPVEWYEVPVTADEPIATQAKRRAGEFRNVEIVGSGRQPTLLAADARDGIWELRYRRWLPADVLGAVAFGLAALICGVLVWMPRVGDRWGRAVDRVARIEVAAGALAVVMVAAGLRWHSAYATERKHAVGRLEAGEVRGVEGMVTGPIKFERLIRPSVHTKLAAAGMSYVIYGDVRFHALRGWVGRQGTHAKGAEPLLQVFTRPVGDGEWELLFERDMARGKAFHAIDIQSDWPDSQLRDVLVQVDSNAPTGTIAFDFEFIETGEAAFYGAAAPDDDTGLSSDAELPANAEELRTSASSEE